MLIFMWQNSRTSAAFASIPNSIRVLVRQAKLRHLTKLHPKGKKRVLLNSIAFDLFLLLSFCRVVNFPAFAQSRGAEFSLGNPPPPVVNS
jgi:hypothetical protein